MHTSYSELVVRGRVELPTFRFSGGRSYQLSYLTWLGPQRNSPGIPAVLTGFEPATSTLTGWRALLAALQDLVSTTIADAASRQGLPQGNRLRPEEHTTGETALRHAVQDTEPAPS